MKTYPETVRFLYRLQRSGMKFGLAGIHRLLDGLDNPERRFPAVHIAGTNGKGSTASIIASILSAAGYRTGLYTSPHLVDFRERIRINGKPIPKRDVVRLAGMLRPAIRKHKSTFFESVTALAFRYFAEKNVDVAVVETGLGGRLDATNVVNPVLTVITSISREHTEFLGNTLTSIAREKAGIIKPGVPCVVGVLPRKAVVAIRRRCRDQSAPLIPVRKKSITLHSATMRGSRISVSFSHRQPLRLFLPLPGQFQIQNLAIVREAVLQLRHQGFRISDRQIRTGV
ncbi:MAG: Mur ligase family protein, partial [Bacteroidota bacterium]